MSTAVKPKLPKVETAKSAAIKADLKIGRAIADQLQPVHSLEEVAAALGVSYQYVRRVECLALAKISRAVKAMARSERA